MTGRTCDRHCHVSATRWNRPVCAALAGVLGFYLSFSLVPGTGLAANAGKSALALLILGIVTAFCAGKPARCNQCHSPRIMVQLVSGLLLLGALLTLVAGQLTPAVAAASNPAASGTLFDRLVSDATLRSTLGWASVSILAGAAAEELLFRWILPRAFYQGFRASGHNRGRALLFSALLAALLFTLVHMNSAVSDDWLALMLRAAQVFCFALALSGICGSTGARLPLAIGVHVWFNLTWFAGPLLATPELVLAQAQQLYAQPLSAVAVAASLPALVLAAFIGLVLLGYGAREAYCDRANRNDGAGKHGCNR